VLVNQAIGFTALHYPRDLATFAWGAAFLAAFVTYEGTFFLVTLLSGSGLSVYAPSIMLRIFELNAVIFHRAAVASGLLKLRISDLRAESA
jgi:hypothetical protein